MLEKENAYLMDIINSNINSMKNNNMSANSIPTNFNMMELTKELEKTLEHKITDTLNNYQKT
jgi:hypothetical protein